MALAPNSFVVTNWSQDMVRHTELGQNSRMEKTRNPRGYAGFSKLSELAGPFVPGEGFEPSRVSSSHFECDASAISPPRLAEAREDDTTERSRSAGYPSLIET
jgi:hypothetical protein